MMLIEQINIVGRQSNYMSGKRRKSSESDYDCIFDNDADSGLYYGFINSDYNINSPRAHILSELARFDRSNPMESLRDTIKEIDNRLHNKGYISRCVVLIYKGDDGIYVAKAGGGIFLYEVCPPLFKDDGFPVSVNEVVSRRWEAERDFYVGSGGAIPLSDRLDTDAFVAVATHPMIKNIEVAFEGSFEEITSENLSGDVSKKSVHAYCNDIFDFVYNNVTQSHSSAYLAFI